MSIDPFSNLIYLIQQLDSSKLNETSTGQSNSTEQELKVFKEDLLNDIVQSIKQIQSDFKLFTPSQSVEFKNLEKDIGELKQKNNSEKEEKAVEQIKKFVDGMLQLEKPLQKELPRGDLSTRARPITTLLHSQPRDSLSSSLNSSLSSHLDKTLPRAEGEVKHAVDMKHAVGLNYSFA